MTPIQYIVNMNINDLENFKVVAQKCIDANRSVNGTVQYDWCINGNTGILFESWANEQAVFDHLEAVGALIPELLETCEFTSINVITPVSDAVKAAFEGLPAQFYEPLLSTVTA